MEFDVTSREGRRGLRDALLDVAPWLGDDTFGPRTVDAGPCDVCGNQPRLIATCGPNAAARCRDCVDAHGDAAWCDGHREVAAAARAWLAQLPDWWAPAVTAWWIATGEVRPGRTRIALAAPTSHPARSPGSRSG